MKKFDLKTYQKQRKTWRHARIPVFVVISFWAFFASVDLRSSLSKAEVMHGNASAELEKKQQDKKEIKNKIEELSMGQGVRRAAREVFRAVEEGEELIIITDE